MAKKKEISNDLAKNLEIDKNELIEEIKGSVKEKLDQEISRRIDYESRNKLDKMERRIYRQKRWALIRRDIVILILIGLAIFEGKILYDNNLLFGLKKVSNTSTEVKSDKTTKEEVKEDKKTEEEKEEKKEEVKKDLAYYKENYGYLLDNIKTNLSGDDKYYLYKNSLKADDLKNSIKLNIVYQLLDVKSSDGILKIDEETIKDKYKEIFGSLDAYEAVNFYDDCVNFIYNKDSKIYMAIETSCNISNKEIFRQIKDIKEDNDKIIIEFYVGILDKEKNEISSIDGDSYEYNDENISKLKTSKFTFKNNYLYKITNE